MEKSRKEANRCVTCAPYKWVSFLTHYHRFSSRTSQKSSHSTVINGERRSSAMHESNPSEPYAAPHLSSHAASPLTCFS